MGRRPTSRVTVLSIISEHCPIMSDDGKAVQTICEAATEYGITRSAAKQQIDALRKLGMIEVLSEKGKMFMVDTTPKGDSYLEQNAHFIKSRIEKKPLVKDETQVTFPEANIQLASPAEFFEACRQAEVMFGNILQENGQLKKQLEQAKTENEKLRQDRAQLEAKNLSLKEENKTLRQKLEKPSGQNGSLRPSALPGVWRELAKKALDQGWSISLTGGDHIRWVSPDGLVVTSSQTPSDHRSVKNTRAQLARGGLKVR